MARPILLTDEKMEEIARRVKEGFSQKDLAEEFHVSYGTLRVKLAQWRKINTATVPTPKEVLINKSKKRTQDTIDPYIPPLSPLESPIKARNAKGLALLINNTQDRVSLNAQRLVALENEVTDQLKHQAEFYKIEWKNEVEIVHSVVRDLEVCLEIILKNQRNIIDRLAHASVKTNNPKTNKPAGLRASVIRVLSYDLTPMNYDQIAAAIGNLGEAGPRKVRICINDRSVPQGTFLKIQKKEKRGRRNGPVTYVALGKSE